MLTPNANLLLSRIEEELAELRKHSEFRTLQRLEGVNLCSNDYLALAADPRLRQAAADALAVARSAGATGSRLLSGHTDEWELVESEFAEFAGTPAALYFNSGYAANVGLLSAVLRPGDLVFSDAMNHASLIDGMRLSGATKVIYPHGDLPFLDRALRANSSPGAKVIVTESVFSMEGDVAPLPGLLRLAGDFGAQVILDEAHAVGVRGPHGSGLAAELGLQRELFAIVHPCGKALASAGAFVCGGTTLKNFLINRARTFLFTTAMPPYLAGQLRAALALVRSADDPRAHLREISAFLRTALVAAGFSCGSSDSQIIPVILGSNDAALHFASFLQAAGFAVRAIRPPTVPQGSARLRFSLTSQITEGDLRKLVEVLDRARHSVSPGAVSALPSGQAGFAHA